MLWKDHALSFMHAGISPPKISNLRSEPSNQSLLRLFSFEMGLNPPHTQPLDPHLSRDPHCQFSILGSSNQKLFHSSTIHNRISHLSVFKQVTTRIGVIFIPIQHLTTWIITRNFQRRSIVEMISFLIPLSMFRKTLRSSSGVESESEDHFIR